MKQAPHWKNISTNNLRAAADQLIYAKSHYCRQYRNLSQSQIDMAESTLDAVYAMMIISAKKLLKVGE